MVLNPHRASSDALPELAPVRELDPWAAAAAAAMTSGATVLLRRADGHRPEDGRCSLWRPEPGARDRRSGDVLSGIVATALAQGLAPEIAAAFAAQVLGRAADWPHADGRRRCGRWTVAALPDLWREWEVLRLARRCRCRRCWSSSGH